MDSLTSMRLRLFAGVLVLASFVTSATPPAGAAETGSIEGKVTTASKQPAANVQVTLVELHRRTAADSQGAFRFDNVPPGMYLVQVLSPRFGSGVGRVVVAGGGSAHLDVSIDLAVHAEEVTVSAGPGAQGTSEVAKPVSVLSGTELQSEIQPTLGETLSRESGVNTTGYSPGASRPVIRGLGGDRIRILEDGIGVGDASNVSEDHAVSTNPMSADRIEIVRGPATLLYGSNAVGGVVNVIDNRIPDHVPDKDLVGATELRYGANASEKSGSLSLDGGVKQLGWHVDGQKLRTDDYEASKDGCIVAGDDPLTCAKGRLANSDIDTKSGTAGFSWVAPKGFVGVSYSRFDTNYGIPTDELVSIDMTQKRWDLKGEYNAPFGFFRAVHVRLGHTDYEHAEIASDGAVGTQFLNDSWETRVELPHRQAGAFKGAFGAQASNRDFQAIGEEGFVPPTKTKNQALFAFETIGTGAVTFEVGARYENQDNHVSDPALPERSFSGVSGSGGLVYKFKENYVLAVSLSHSTRFPTSEELYANGPHLATFQFEIGDPNLNEETSEGVDVSFRKQKGLVSGELNLFDDRFNDFIFLSPTGNFVDVDGELVPEFQYLQHDASFGGAEAHLDFDVLHREPHHLQVELRADYVRAEDRTTSDPLPRIPPLRTGIGLRYQGEKLWGLVEGRHTDQQDRVAPNETTTDGYTWLNASLGYRILAGRTVHDLVLRGTNLTDKLARNHVSPLKDVVPLAGRDVSLSYRLEF